jgi:hypothetical protein
MSGATRFYTKTKTTAFTITSADGVTRMSLDVVSGTCDIEGNFAFQGDASGPVTLSAGKTGLVTALSPDTPIDGVTVTPSGTINVLMSF